MKARALPSVLLLLALVAGACSGTAETTTTTTAAATSTTQPAPTTGSSEPPASDPAPPEPSAQFEEADCAFNEPLGTEPRCGYLTVPENRDEPTGSQVRLHVAIFEATGSDPRPDPIVYLEGGPGGHILDALEFSYSTRFEPLTEQRDLIIFDQRGVGLSEPALDCPEARELEIELLDDDLPLEEVQERQTGALVACRDRLVGDGVDLTAYNSATNAADVADLRTALGYDEVNLWGISYGTRLGLTVMRDQPEGIRSVVLDSTVPVDLDLYPAIPASADRAFEVFFEGCAADPVCNEAYPTLEDDFYAVAEELSETPVDIVVTDFLSGERYPALLFGDDVYGLLFQSLYNDEIIPLLPGFITDAAAGDYAGFEQLSSVFFTNGPFVSDGMYLSVQCNEEYPFSTAAEVGAAVDAHPNVAGLFVGAETEYDDCALWGAGIADAVENQPVSSAIPTLILGGEYDPITPPSYGEQAGVTLANSTFFEFPGLAHGVTSAAECPTQIVLDFLDDPTASPDGSCISEMGPPQFFVPGNVTVTMIPFEADVFGFAVSGVRPEGWDESQLGFFTAPGLGDTAILQQAFPAGVVTPDQLAEQYGTQFGIEGGWSGPTSYNDGARDWQVYEGEAGSLLFDLGLTEDGDNLLVVLLISTSSTRDTYVDQVFFPAMDALQAG